ncbi:hypothetical protein (plasmid) [Citrobacter freundii]|uniref:Uncharacterized protein n=10 Tax=Enterobacteriaceae TaxID=543 RepID=A0A173GLZ1_ECOLX|nr:MULTISPECIES: hypothetical protein [Enterobacterales]AQT24052.1 hypothetical protein [Salmonella enterica subsp. enterica serovar Enteritidis]AVE24116.1 hypothetical protein [Citrobacter freundii]AWD72939.1 hypothetical protein [Raoultella ornithinolytica]AZZ87366.1 hypothetical protein [Escherichia coli O157]EHC84214.1 hypothetical protein LTSEMON_6313 [Salmonella enterica subsp. enterica serovar Montevideo str. S5-403]EHW01897.1 hypothetical protein ECDEC8A_5647 [Escherichia coli DEC8A]
MLKVTFALSVDLAVKSGQLKQAVRHHRQNVTFVAGALPMPEKGNLNLPNRN